MNPCMNHFTRVLVEWMTDTSGNFCIADVLRADAKDITPERLKRCTFMLLTTEEHVWELPVIWRRLLTAALTESSGVDWEYVCTVLATNHTHN